MDALTDVSDVQTDVEQDLNNHTSKPSEEVSMENQHDITLVESTHVESFVHDNKIANHNSQEHIDVSTSHASNQSASLIDSASCFDTNKPDKCADSEVNVGNNLAPENNLNQTGIAEKDLASESHNFFAINDECEMESTSQENQVAMEVICDGNGNSLECEALELFSRERNHQSKHNEPDISFPALNPLPTSMANAGGVNVLDIVSNERCSSAELESESPDYTEQLLSTVQQFNVTTPYGESLTAPQSSVSPPAIIEYTNLDKQVPEVYEDISDSDNRSAREFSDSSFCEWNGLEKINGSGMIVPSSVGYEFVDENYHLKQKDLKHPQLFTLSSQSSTGLDLAITEDKQFNDSLPSMSAFQTSAPTAGGDGPSFTNSPSSSDQYNSLPMSCSLSTTPEPNLFSKPNFQETFPELNQTMNSLATDFNSPSYAMEFYNLEPSPQVTYNGVPHTTDIIMPPSDLAPNERVCFNQPESLPLSPSHYRPTPYSHPTNYAIPTHHRHNHHVRFSPYPFVRGHYHGSPYFYSAHRYPHPSYYYNDSSSCGGYAMVGPSSQMIWNSRQSFRPTCSNFYSPPYANHQVANIHSENYPHAPRRCLNPALVHGAHPVIKPSNNGGNCSQSRSHCPAPYRPIAEDITPVASATDVTSSVITCAEVDSHTQVDTITRASSITSVREELSEIMSSFQNSEEKGSCAIVTGIAADQLCQKSACQVASIQTDFSLCENETDSQNMSDSEDVEDGGKEKGFCDCRLPIEMDSDDGLDNTVENS